MRIITASILSLVLTAGALAQPVYEESRRGGVVDVRHDDPVMEAAKAKGRATLDEFLAVMRAAKPEQRGFSVKVGFRGEDGVMEYFWIEPFRLTGERGSGTLANRPIHVERLRAGQTVGFAKGEVVDWNYMDGRVMRGNFTGCAVLVKASDEDRQAFREQTGLDCGSR